MGRGCSRPGRGGGERGEAGLEQQQQPGRGGHHHCREHWKHQPDRVCPPPLPAALLSLQQQCCSCPGCMAPAAYSGQACLARVTAATHWAGLSPPPANRSRYSLTAAVCSLQSAVSAGRGETWSAVLQCCRSPLQSADPFYRASRVTTAWRSSFDMQITLFIGRN